MFTHAAVHGSSAARLCLTPDRPTPTAPSQHIDPSELQICTYPTAAPIGIASTEWTHVHVHVIATLDCGDPKGNRRATARPPPHHAPAHAAERSPCARSAPKVSLHLAADFRPPVTPSVQIFTLRYDEFVLRGVCIICGAVYRSGLQEYRCQVRSGFYPGH